jgi:hypothetical protein
MVHACRVQPGVGGLGTFDRRQGTIGGKCPPHPDVKVSGLDQQLAVFGAEPERHRKGKKPTVEAQFRLDKRALPAGWITAAVYRRPTVVFK